MHPPQILHHASLKKDTYYFTMDSEVNFGNLLWFVQQTNSVSTQKIQINLFYCKCNLNIYCNFLKLFSYLDHFDLRIT